MVKLDFEKDLISNNLRVKFKLPKISKLLSAFVVDILRPGHNFEACLTLNLKQVFAHFDTVGKLSWLHRDVGLLKIEHVGRIFLNLMSATKIFLTK